MRQYLLAYGYLFLAIISEVIGTACLTKSEQFSRIVPTGIMVVCFVAALYLLSQALKAIPLGIAYAIWAGLGIVLTAAIGFLAFGQKLDGAALVGIGMIVGGVVVINLFSTSAGH